ncbi:MAG: beta-ketoacyl-[acyl-carrier-protein] synthase family protein, partial [Proteobacteria bacterium]
LWLKKNQPQALISATKGYTGHTLGAAGAVEAVLTILCLLEQKLPASRGFAELDPAIGIAPTTETVNGIFTSALSLSLGFGGTNAALYFGCAV